MADAGAIGVEAVHESASAAAASSAAMAVSEHSRRTSLDSNANVEVDVEAIRSSQMRFEALVSKSSSRSSSISHPAPTNLKAVPETRAEVGEQTAADNATNNSNSNKVVTQDNSATNNNQASNASNPNPKAEIDASGTGEAPAKRRRLSPSEAGLAANLDAPGDANTVGADDEQTSPSSSATVSANPSPTRDGGTNAAMPEHIAATAAVAASSASEPAPGSASNVRSAGVSAEAVVTRFGRASRSRTPLPELASDDAPPSMSIMYSPGSMLPKLRKHMHQIVEVRIPAKYLTTRNKEIQTRQLWGTDKYTDDSDVVAMLMHTGKYFLRPTPPPKIAGLSVFLRILPEQSNYAASTRFQLRSRSWAPQFHRCTVELVRTHVLREASQLDPRAQAINTKAAKNANATNGRRIQSKRRFVTDVTVMFNSTNDPCLKYCLGLVADRGMNSDEWTSTRLQREVLYLESRGRRYELCRLSTASPPKQSHDMYRLSRVPPEVFGSESESKEFSAPLPSSKIVQAIEDLDWEEIEWGPYSFSVRDKVYPVDTMWFRPVTASG